MIRVVLFRPETSGNIGAVARVMKNLGFRDLVLVDASCEVDEESRKRAKHARDVLEEAEIRDRMSWDEFDLTVSTSSETGGDYNVTRNALSPELLCEKLEKAEGKVGLIFGPESKGLTNEEIKKTDFLCHIPADRDYPVFNLSHAVAIVLYELSSMGGGTSYQLAKDDEKRVLFEQLDRIVEKADIEEYRKDSLKQSLRNAFGRSMLSRKEANTIIGFFRRVKESIV